MTSFLFIRGLSRDEGFKIGDFWITLFVNDP